MIKNFNRCLAPLLGLVFLTSCGVEFTATDDDVPIAAGSSVYELLVLQESQDNALNIVFLPDGSYGDMSDLDNRQAFLNDLELVIEDGYWENHAFYYNLGFFNYYYMTESGTAAAPADPNDCPIVTWPDEVDTDAAFADLVLMLHTNVLRDCRWGNKATSEPNSFRTIVHESSHALFNLPDEYCCDGGYRTFSPIMYTTQAACLNDAANVAWRNCVSFVSTATSTNGQTFWRSEGNYVANEIMTGPVSATVYEMGPGDWAASNSVLNALNGSTPVSPTVIAPAAWVNPNTP